ncbi:hypothetical protein PIB30_101272 [Stylosanthes scabra]|uniref:Uncharacterized protein n=1 Tax=Stylosanthes scabra TaxID=79078 RepID=A0ABU6TXU3_9FABA|nr:hypothetical protein [Stylosanthes scabra]
MAKKKSCQNVRVPRVLSLADRELYSWVDEEIFTQPSVVEADILPELRREMRLTVDRAAEGILYWRLLREVLSRCRVAASQLYLNGWGFLRTFERGCVCILASNRRAVFSFIPISCIFLPLERVLCPSVPTKVESSLTVLKSLFKSSNDIKVLPLPGKRPFWLDDEGAPFPWVYWNTKVEDFRVTALDPLEALAFEFLQSLPAGLGKNQTLSVVGFWTTMMLMLGHSLLKDMEKQSHFDRLMQKMKEAEGSGPRSILPSSKAQTTASDTSASDPAAPASIPTTLVPPALSSSASKVSGNSTNVAAAKPFSVEMEEGVREDPGADLRQKRRKRKVSEASAEEATLGGDSSWKHKANPIDHAFPLDYNFRAAWMLALRMVPSGRFLALWSRSSFWGPLSSLLANSSLAFSVENTFAAKVRLEKELAATKDQVDVLTPERDSTLAAPLFHAKIKSLTEELERVEGEHLSAFDRMEEVERKAKVQAAELESCHSALT